MGLLDKKYQIFISSTYKDLINSRDEIIKSILNLYQIPIGMEMFSADNEEQWAVIKKTIDYSDYYILVIGHRYGSLSKEGISYTEKEFDYAKSLGIPIYAFVRKRDVSTLAGERESEPKKIKLLQKFIDKVEGNTMVEYWEQTSDLGQKVATSLIKAFDKTPQLGWQKGSTLENGFLKDFLYKTYLESSGIFEDNSNVFVDEFGNADFTLTRVQRAKTMVSHNRLAYGIDKPGKIILKEVYDIDLGQQLQFLSHKESEVYHIFFILFNEVLKKGASFKYRFSLYCENYLSNVVDKKIGYIVHRTTQKFVFERKIDTYYFPDIPIYDTLEIKIDKHPNKSIIGSIIPYKLDNGYKIFTIDYGDIKGKAIFGCVVTRN
jgi:hypothetical protein